MRALVALLLLALASGCATYNRGELAAASTLKIAGLEGEPVAGDVEGRACGDWPVHRLEDAIDDALKKAPGADALDDASFYFADFCLVVRGTPIRTHPDVREESE